MPRSLSAAVCLAFLLAPLSSSAATSRPAAEHVVPLEHRLAVPPVRPFDPWRPSVLMRAWLGREVSPGGTRDDRMVALLQALDTLGLVFDDTITRTAEEVFTSRRFNCLGLAHLVVGLARELDIPAYYVHVVTPDAYQQRGDLMLAAAHVAAGWGPSGTGPYGWVAALHRCSLRAGGGTSPREIAMRRSAGSSEPPCSAPTTPM